MELIASSGISPSATAAVAPPVSISPSATAAVAPPVIHAGVVMPRPRPRPRGAGMALFARLLEAVRDAAARMPERRALPSVQLRQWCPRVRNICASERREPVLRFSRVLLHGFYREKST